MPFFLFYSLKLLYHDSDSHLLPLSCQPVSGIQLTTQCTQLHQGKHLLESVTKRLRDFRLCDKLVVNVLCGLAFSRMLQTQQLFNYSLTLPICPLKLEAMLFSTTLHDWGQISFLPSLEQRAEGIP